MNDQYIAPNPTYLLTEDGYLMVLQRLRCMACLSWGDAYLDMSKVTEDKVQDVPCPGCNAEELHVVTFTEKE